MNAVAPKKSSKKTPVTNAKGGVVEKALKPEKAPRATIEDPTSGPVKVEAKCKEPKELRAESKRGRLLEMLKSAKGVRQDAATKEFEWKNRDFADALRLLAKQNGVNTARDERGVWHAAN